MSDVSFDEARGLSARDLTAEIDMHVHSNTVRAITE